MTQALFRRISVWELPVRFYHWINALCILVLVATGLIIGRAWALQTGGEAFQGYGFGTVRFLHFLATFVFFFSVRPDSACTPP
jgi:Ni/Fe-hydrogenase 1 B-type cytochrome subunit